MRNALIIVLTVALAGCDSAPSNNAEFEERLRDVLQEKPTGSGVPVALMKDGLGGAAWLATIHGYPDNRSVCEQLIEPYNSDPEMSALPGTYSCREV